MSDPGWRAAVVAELGARNWEERGECRGHPRPELWWPSAPWRLPDDDPFTDEERRDNHGAEAKRICSGCPVREECLVDALLRGERFGIRGGAGASWRRALTRALLACAHDPLQRCDDGDCRWCFEIEAHWGRLESRLGEATPHRAFTDAATHGRRSTYARGCRCPACRWSATHAAQALARQGVDTAAWWVSHVGQVSEPLGPVSVFAATELALLELQGVAAEVENAQGRRIRLRRLVAWLRTEAGGAA